MPSYGFGGSDVIVGWVRNDGTCDQGCVKDYLATQVVFFVMSVTTIQRQLPTLDSSQDVSLVRGWEEGSSTVIEFTRSLNTGDSSDRAINPDSPIPSTLYFYLL